MPRLSVIVPATDRPPTLERCLAAIRAADNPPEEILVVSSEPRGAGPALARNAAAAEATCEILVFVDSDVAVHADSFERIRAQFGGRPELDALFGSYDESPSEAGLVSIFRNLLHHHVHQASPGHAYTFWAGLGAIRREVFLAASGFDAERFGPPSVEDVELGMRLTQAGARMELDAGLLGTHHKGWTLRRMMRTDLVGRGIPWVGVLMRRRSLPPVLNLRWPHRLSAALSLAVFAAALRRRPLALAGSVGALWSLNRSFYSLLLRKVGPARLPLAVGLHVVHHLTAVMSVPIGVVLHLTGAADGPGGLEAPATRISVERGDELASSANGRGARADTDREPETQPETAVLG